MDVLKLYFNIILLVIVQVTAVIGGECCLSYVALDGIHSGSFWCPNVCCYLKREKPSNNTAHPLIDFRSRECCDDPDLQVYSYERDVSCAELFYQDWYYDTLQCYNIRINLGVVIVIKKNDHEHGPFIHFYNCLMVGFKVAIFSLMALVFINFLYQMIIPKPFTTTLELEKTGRMHCSPPIKGLVRKPFHVWRLPQTKYEEIHAVSDV
ncbi:hypothetical protein MAR_022715 [Mya arenaria]|uniref:Uncharacterized protein n=1 Tax=Mya arenaria TaxID=6604 RepID=A0ABY7DNP5_MYAAR|nr:hypothetical protein MAR_022715 [Mya arenaria]